MKPVDSKVEANKVFTLLGKEYRPGDPVDVSKLGSNKVAQLMNQRYLRPVNPD